MMHAKTVVVDGAWSVVGSANLDERSMELNEENILGIADRDFARAVEEGVEADLERSREIHLDQWRKRPIYQKIFWKSSRRLLQDYRQVFHFQDA